MSIEKAGNNISVRPGSTSLHIVNNKIGGENHHHLSLSLLLEKQALKNPKTKLALRLFNYFMP
jgi:hypothetical protein